MFRNAIFGSLWVFVLAAVGMRVAPLAASDSNWTNTAGGVFNVTGNWSAGVPLPADDATFNLNNTYTVTFSTSPTNTGLLVQNGAVTFNLAGQTYTLTGSAVLGGIAGQTGRLTLTNGEIDGADLHLGFSTGATGFLTVTTNGKWSGGASAIGEFGLGNLAIQNGGIVDSTSAGLGTAATGIGTATVSGSGSTWDAGNLVVSGAGTGSLAVSAGGLVVSASSSIANAATAEGEVTVSGSGSRWTNGGSFLVANVGHGKLSVLSGGTVQSGSSTLGVFDGAEGEATVSGPGSLWRTTTLFLGDDGAGELMISSGGRMESSSITFGRLAGSSGNATVTGAGSSWSAVGAVLLGLASAGNLSVLDGATMISAGSINLGANAGGDGSLTVDGPGSSYSSAGNMLIGAIGHGFVTVSNGAAVELTSSTGRIEIANNAASGFLSALVVSGNGSRVTAPGGVFVSGSNTAAGGTGQLTVSNGGFLDAGGGTVKIWPVAMAGISLHGGTIHTRHFERLESFDFRDGLLHIDGGTFTNGAAATALTINGFDADDLPILRLSNAATTANVGNAIIGNSNAGGLDVLSGSTIQSGVSTVGNTVNGNGTVVVDGPGSTWTMGGLQLGASGQALMHIRNGGKVSSNSSTLGGASSATGTVTVEGGEWSVASSLDVGINGRGSLDVRDGGLLVSSSANIGLNASGTGTVNVVGPDSRWTTNSLVIGNNGRGTLSIKDGGSLSSGGGSLAATSTSNATVTIDGAGSLWESNGPINIGLGGNGALSVLDGGRFTSPKTRVGGSPSGVGTATISGPGTVWNNTTGLFIGGNDTIAAGVGLVSIEDGATLNVDSVAGQLKIWNPGGTLTLDGGTINARQFERLGNFNFRDGTFNVTAGQYISAGPLTLDGADADDLPTLRLAAGATTSGITSLTVGDTRRGALEISGGSVLTSNDGSIAALPGSSGSVSLASGAAWNLASSLTVGGTTGTAGGNGTLTIGHGTSVNVPTNSVRLRTDGVINLNSGTLQMLSFEPLGGQFNFNSGTVSFTGSATLSDAMLTTILGAPHSLSAGRNLTGGFVTLNAPMSVDGGSFSPVVVNLGSILQINSGTLISGSTSTIQPAGLLRLSNTGVGDFGTLTNNGQVELAADTATLSGSSFVNNGVLSGRGRILSPLTNNAVGSVRAENGARLNFLGATNNNAGRIEALSGGTIEFQQSLNNNANALITGHDGVLRFNGGLTNAGSLGFTTGTMDVFGDITNQAPGKIVVSGRGTATFYDDLANNGSVQVSTGSTAVYFGTVSGTGSFPGGGTNFFEGDLRPGASPAIVNFAGDVEFGSASSLQIEIGGTTPGTQHDQINIGGTATLNGTLDIDLINGFMPSIGQQFQVMTFGSRSGTFANVTGGDVSPTVQLEPVYSATDLKLVVVGGGEKIWGVDAGGAASVGANWLGGVAPLGVNDAAAFTTAITADRMVQLDVPLNLSSVRFDDDNRYTLQGGTLTLQAAGAAPVVINVQNAHGNGAHTISAPVVLGSNLNITQQSSGALTIAGALDNSSGRTITKSGAGTLILSGAQTHGAGAVLTVSAGTANINTNAGSNTVRNLTVNANSATNFGASQHLAALNVGAGATATLTSGGPKNLVINALSIAGGATPTGKLDITNNATIVDFPVAGPSPAPTIRQQIIVGRGGTGLGKPWNGLGITSSTAQADVAASPNSRSVGYAVNADLPLGALTTFRGQAVDPSSVLIRYTRTADANLDGVVNDDDVTVVGTFYAPGVPKPEWAKGDFDYNGFVDDDDVTLLGVFYNPSATPIPAPAAEGNAVAATGGSGVATVPEPSSWVLACVFLFAVLVHRRQFGPSKIEIPWAALDSNQ